MADRRIAAGATKIGVQSSAPEGDIAAYAAVPHQGVYKILGSGGAGLRCPVRGSRRAKRSARFPGEVLDSLRC